MQRQTTVALLLLAASLRTALAYDAEDWPTHHRFDDGTSGFARVAAVPNPARLRERFDVREGAGQ